MATIATTPATVRPIDLRTEMGDSYRDYAVATITSRALPSVYDGLKPVQRRILYATAQMKLGSRGQHRKSAAVVGDVIGKYHPHGDGAIYDALVRMAQTHTMRYPLIDGQGNFGTTDDPPAAMRYTEARLTPAGEMLVASLEEDTVDMRDTFDGSRQEPELLPAGFPHLLANGALGIAVGMRTGIPPYNIGEIVDLALWALDHPTVSPQKWPKDIVPAPDFPTRGTVIVDEECRSAVLDGHGRVKIRASVSVESVDGRPSLVCTELPYQVGADGVLEAMGKAIREKAELDVVDVRNETSARTGLRLVFVLRPGADPQKVLRRLWRSTKLQHVYAVNALALCDGVPRRMGVAHMLKRYIDGRIGVVERRTRHRLRVAEHKLESVEGQRIAAANIDEVVQIIRSKRSVAGAKKALSRRFDLTKVQAEAVVSLRLGRLTGLSVIALDKEAADLRKTVGHLSGILADRSKVRAIIGKELSEARDALDDGRRSALADANGTRLHVRTVTTQVDACGTVRTGGRDGNLGHGLWTVVGPEDGRFCAVLSNAEIASVRPRTSELAAPVVWAGPRPSGLLVLFSNGRLRRHEMEGPGPWKVTPPKGAPPVVSATVDSGDPYSALFVVTAGGYILKFPKVDLMEGGRLQSVIRLGASDEAVAIGDTAMGDCLVVLTEAGTLLAMAGDRVSTSSRGNRGRRARFGRLADAACVPSAGLLRVSNDNRGASAASVPLRRVLESGNKGVRVGGASRLATVAGES